MLEVAREPSLVTLYKNSNLGGETKERKCIMNGGISWAKNYSGQVKNDKY